MPRTSISKLRDEALAEKQKLIESGEYVPEAEEDNEIEEVKKTKKATPKKQEKKTFKDSDLINCVSVTVGRMVMIGTRSNEKYTWEGMNAVVGVEYRDLVGAIRKHSALVFKPRFIIQDADFLAQYPEINDLYGSLYTSEDIEKILDLPADKMKAYIVKMPQGAKDALLGIAIAKIDSGRFDSVQRIKVIDELFGTQMLLKVTQ